MRIFWHSVIVLCLAFGFFVPAFGQSPVSNGSPSGADTAKTAEQTGANSEKPKQENEKEIEKREQSQRMLGVLPQFGTTSRRNAPPLTPKEKFHLFAKSAFDPVELSVVGVQAAFSQAEDEFPEYGQGAAGYGKRYGATLADEASSGFFSNFAYPVLFKEDPRYFSPGRRIFQA